MKGNNNIVFVINSLKVGGAAKMIQFVATQVKDLFDEVTMVSIFDAKTEGFLPPSIKRVNLGVRPKQNVLFRTWNVLHKLRRLFKQTRPQYICSFVDMVAVYSRISSLGLNAVVISAERGDPGINPKIQRMLVKWAYNHSDFCFFQLSAARDYFGERIRRKAFVIPNAFPQNNLISPNFESREKIIVSAGRFTIQKGYDILIKAFRIVHDKHPDYKLVLFGEGALYDDYIKQIADYNLNGFVEFPGYCKDVPQAIQNASVFVLSSRWEGIPNTMIEAMSVGIPVVACDCPPGGPKFLSNEGNRAIIVPMDDVNAMAVAINGLLDAPDAAIAMAKRGLEILDELDENVIGERWISAFQEIMSRYE